jgi:hypothetical protein
MSRPGTDVVVSDATPPRSAPTDTGVGFFVGEAAQGPTDAPALIRSMSAFEDTFGERFNPPYLYDAAECFFREGGARLYVLRLADDDAVVASASNDPIDVDATSPGTWANTVKLQTSTSGSGKVAEVSVGSVVEERSGLLSTVADLVAFAAASRYVRASAPDENLGDALTNQTWTLTGGADGTLPVTDPDVFAAALDHVQDTLGPGQLAAPGKSDPDFHAALLAAAGVQNRIALLDCDPSDDVAGLVAEAAAQRGSDDDRYGALWAPWATIPGRARGTLRTVPWSGIQAGLIARSDASGNANQAAAGLLGVSRVAVGLDTEYSDSEREQLMEAGVNTARVVYGDVRSYGYRTLVDPDGTHAAWLPLSSTRLAMAIKAECQEVAESYVFAQIDGQGRTLGRFNGELVGVCLKHFQNGGLYGSRPEEAFRVDTGEAVNTPETIADGELRASVALKMSPFAEYVYIEIVKTAITDTL